MSKVVFPEFLVSLSTLPRTTNKSPKPLVKTGHCLTPLRCLHLDCLHLVKSSICNPSLHLVPDLFRELNGCCHEAEKKWAICSRVETRRRGDAITHPALQLLEERRRREEKRQVKHERDEERFDRLPGSVIPTGTCPDHVGRWQVVFRECVRVCPLSRLSGVGLVYNNDSWNWQHHHFPSAPQVRQIGGRDGFSIRDN